MKTAGSLLSSIFSEQEVKIAHVYSRLFDSWTDITAKNNIAYAADYSRIKEFEKGIVLIEIDHPGWKQILQTKQCKLLNDFRYRFPELNIMGLSLILGSGKSRQEKNQETKEYLEAISKPEYVSDKADAGTDSGEDSKAASQADVASIIENIKDDELREKLIKLGQAVAEREKIT